MTAYSYVLLPSAFGTLGIVWRETQTGPKIYRVVLPDENTPLETVIQRAFGDAVRQTCPAITELGERIQSFLQGGSVDFDLNLIALERCSEFQQRVLLAEYAIPRGWVSTYGRIARHVGVPGGARAVGRALATNPFPIIIPCHRAVRANGELGGYRGGQKMKRALLEWEGIEFSPTGKVRMDRVYY
jgi:methylated-DNA-[protein]-cysteine S-methyltransferase